MDISELKLIPLFSELKESDLEQIAKMTVRQVYKKDNMVLIEEEVGSTMFVILNGRVKISRISDEGREVILSILVDGDFFGEMSILDGQTRSANAVTLEDTELLIIRRENFLQILHSYPQVAINLLKELAHRLRRSDAQIKSLSLQNALGKVGSTLLRIADDSGIIKQGKVEISQLPPQQDLANMAGTSRETISRVIKSLGQLGYVKKEGSKLIILDYERFRQDFS
ncbi:MAG TPA: Crp/Fnr family transcriptional regulator [Caldithrix abyssi]|uniref:Crp/Fnr family transcriptional regulator n=1 Tax=Caldithrix abyssi TaxID=187145 RepID=A0A7V4U2C8_CALAY|nr:Crp/Fnr family transcriptional regulator [Caldithrix abyssi]